MSTPDSGGQIRPFAAVLQEVDGGKALVRLADLLQQCTSAVTDTGKKATLTVVVEVAPYKKGHTATLDVTVKSAAKLPQGDDAVSSGVFFATKDGNLTRNDPNQPMLPLRGIDTRKVANQ